MTHRCSKRLDWDGTGDAEGRSEDNENGVDANHFCSRDFEKGRDKKSVSCELLVVDGWGEEKGRDRNVCKKRSNL